MLTIEEFLNFDSDFTTKQHIHYDKHTASCCTRCFKSFGFSKRNEFATKGIDHNEESFRK